VGVVVFGVSLFHESTRMGVGAVVGSGFLNFTMLTYLVDLAANSSRVSIT
jgi:hypothetical protein